MRNERRSGELSKLEGLKQYAKVKRNPIRPLTMVQEQETSNHHRQTWTVMTIGGRTRRLPGTGTAKGPYVVVTL